MHFITNREKCNCFMCFKTFPLLSLSFANVHRESQFLVKVENGIKLKFILNLRKNKHILEYLPN